MPKEIMLQTDERELFGMAAGSPDKPAILLVHGWPLSNDIWRPVIDGLSKDHFVVAVDLPGIGRSSRNEPPVLKAEIAAVLLDAIETTGATDLTFVGVDIGGMIAFAAARDHANRLSRAVIINTVVPGVAPWEKVLANPAIWHFAFHQTPDLPELLVAGRERGYFDYFLDMLAADSSKISNEMREQLVAAYSDSVALKTGFGWYRAMPEDAKHNRRKKIIDTPILYLRSDGDHRPMAPYLDGLQAAGAANTAGEVIVNCGEIVSIEQPEKLITHLSEFTRQTWGEADRGEHQSIEIGS